MKKQIGKVIDWDGDNIPPKATTSATSKIFNIDKEAKLLSNEQTEIFYSVVITLLYISKRARPDIEPTIAYLCTRVPEPKYGDWGKLQRVLSFLKWTIDE